MMGNLSEDIQSADSDTRPPMLDRSDFESWQQRPFKTGKFRETLADGALGLERDRVVKDLTPEEKERYKADIRATNILLQGSELTRDERESQLYVDFEHFFQNKGKTIHEYYGRFMIAVKLNRGLKTSNYDQLYAYLKQHKAHANENKMMLEKYTQHAIDPLAFVSNVSLQQYPTQSSTILQSTHVPLVTYQPQFTDCWDLRFDDYKTTYEEKKKDETTRT
ncbi:hypothetical protein Tco_0083788 [Tanacetum coccineum]